MPRVPPGSPEGSGCVLAPAVLAQAGPTCWIFSGVYGGAGFPSIFDGKIKNCRQLAWLQPGCGGSGEPISSSFARSHWHYATSRSISICLSQVSMAGSPQLLTAPVPHTATIPGHPRVGS